MLEITTPIAILDADMRGTRRIKINLAINYHIYSGIAEAGLHRKRAQLSSIFELMICKYISQLSGRSREGEIRKTISNSILTPANSPLQLPLLLLAFSQ
ncbi:hypothetical protein I7I53_08634 [Histoplasma capsulatum var. duboisii H88]|uniref:Uncharacterized protein n=1 Tax=Ajellomyces capsulatus (strain H88) TaxID=544711 RepID=A0A8A1LIV1_AJEC8|nr:hypothetical protein I7I53_08634 [Histoplasma capsulatum var. duboisii H88]